MLPLNPWMLLGVLGILVPIFLHILTRQTGQTVPWGAMVFLKESLIRRNRRIRLEEALLMATRCLLVALLAVALARPFVPPGSQVPWFLVLPLFFLAVVALAVALVLWELKGWRVLLLFAAVLCGSLGAGLVWFEKNLNLSRFRQGGRQDIVLIIDASSSMGLRVDGRTNLNRALEEAREIVRRSPRGNAFGLILGGPSPSARIGIPTRDREAVLRELAEIEPLDGSMAAYDCLTLAALGLAQGAHPAKQVILLTDGQSVGWELQQTARWAFLKEAFENLPSTPQILIRNLPLPRQVRNLSIREVSCSRSVVGTDRPVSLQVAVENTGTEAVSPSFVELTIGNGEPLKDVSLGQMLPGAVEVVEFFHRFPDSGAQSLQARVEVKDEMEADDERAYVVAVEDQLRVLLVEGRFGGPFLERSASFASLAMAPGSELVRQDGDEERRYLLEPTVLSALEFSRMTSLEAYDAVYLLDVVRLPKESMQVLEGFVEKGGGLLFAAGAKADPDFFNAWQTREGGRFLPLGFGKVRVADVGRALPALSLNTFRHGALRAVKDPESSDLHRTVWKRFWRLSERGNEEAAVGGRFESGDPWMAVRRLGEGQVVQLSTSLDLSDGNLPLQQAFVPFLHELTYFLANPQRQELNLRPSWDFALRLGGEEEGVDADLGLRGDYYAGANLKVPQVTRTDRTIQFDWRQGSPAPGVPVDDFRVKWQGRLMVPKSGKWEFRAEVDDELELFLDGRSILRQGKGRKARSRQVWLEEGRSAELVVTYEEETENATVIVQWRGPGMPWQVIPPTAFRQSMEEKGNVLREFEVVGPAGRERKGLLTATAKGPVVKIQGDVAAGLYQMRIPSEERGRFAHLLPPESEVLPFTVTRDPEESALSPLTKGDREFLENYLGLLYPEDPGDVLRVLSGGSFGEELWRTLAVAALLFLLLESSLTRWISRSRQAGQEATVSFG